MSSEIEHKIESSTTGKVRRRRKPRVCRNEDCNRETRLRYCGQCYEAHMAANGVECETEGCDVITASRWCSECRFAYRAENHLCEDCGEVYCGRRYCDACYRKSRRRGKARV